MEQIKIQIGSKEYSVSEEQARGIKRSIAKQLSDLDAKRKADEAAQLFDRYTIIPDDMGMGMCKGCCFLMNDGGCGCFIEAMTDRCSSENIIYQEK